MTRPVLIALTVALLAAAAGLVTAVVAGPDRPAVPPAPIADADAAPPSAQAVLDDLAKAAPLAKLAPALRSFARGGLDAGAGQSGEGGDSDASVGSDTAVDADAAERFIMVQSAQPIDLSSYSAFVHAFTWPAGEHVAVLKADASDVLAIANLPGVYRVDDLTLDSAAMEAGAPRLPDVPADLAVPDPECLDPAELRRLAQAAPPWSDVSIESVDDGRPAIGARATTRDSDAFSPPPAVLGEGSGVGAAVGSNVAAPAPDGWWDVRHGHAAMEAWDMGFRGEGVTAAVLDDAVDFANPDLVGTWRTLPEGHPYEFWPQAFDPVVGAWAVQDKALAPGQEAQRSSRSARTGMIELYQTSTVAPPREVRGQVAATACFTPLLYQGGANRAVPGDPDCDYIVPAASKSGTVRFGHHPDAVLRGLGARTGIQGEWAGVLLVDARAAGEYDTVYVDLDNDRDFSDEKPTTRDDPLAWRDLTNPPDGLPDVTGGLLYFISNSELPFPGSWVWGLEKDVPRAGEVVGFLYSAGSHGTQCASSIVSQGRIQARPDQDMGFRDLNDGPPPGIHHGLAPAARVVSVGSVYSGGPPGTGQFALFAPAWRYVIFGHDPTRADDAIQAVSNSYGWSADDIDNWDGDSRLIDHYVRKFAPETTFHFATGNGGPGYGTLVPPSPSVGIDVAASTQMGSTGYDSITDTMQITYGDIIPFSCRGPGASGTTGPDVAADGAYAAGNVPINSYGDGRRAINTWGGTSRSTPVATAATTIVYQAFKARHGRWPTWHEARAILMGGARFSGYDPFVMGAGVVDVADSARIASGKHGVYATPSEWRVGGYRGTAYAAFPSVIAPGEQSTARITLHNPADAPVTVRLSAQTPRRIGSYEEALTTALAEESGPGAVPDYLRRIDKSKIPAGTDLMVVRGIFPLEQFDVGGNYSTDNGYTFEVLQHTDIDGDGKLWDDRNGNGVVNYRAPGDALVEARWGGESLTLDGLQAGWTPRLPGDGVEAEMAWYGSACNVTDAAGQTVPAEPEQDVREKIAVVYKGTCTYTIEAQNAQAKGAIAIVMVSDGRAKTAMNANGMTIPGVMVERRPGIALRDALRRGGPVTGRLSVRPMGRTKGIGGAIPILYRDSEIDAYEYMRFSQDSSAHNNWQVGVHHPLERWADGLYVALVHGTRSEAVPSTEIRLRYDFYRYQPWDAVRLGTTDLTIPAKGEASVDATFEVATNAPAGAMQGAIFADYERGAGDVPVPGPGGYELPGRRTMIPVHAAIVPRFDWSGAVTLGGSAGDDRDAPYNNGAVYGTFNWAWRPESGDWRFFFVDAAAPPDGTMWLFRTRWTDAKAGQADIDTRVWGPQPDRYNDPADPANQAEPRADPSWYGANGITQIARSTLTNGGGSTYRFASSTGEHEDWLTAPAAGGLHEVMLHNVLFSGTQFEMPFETTVGALRVVPQHVKLYGAGCTTVVVHSTIDVAATTMEAYGLAVPEVVPDIAVSQDPAGVVNAGVKRDLVLATDAARLRVAIEGDADDNLNLYVLFDSNGDGQFAYPGESIGQSAAAGSREQVAPAGIRPAGKYQIWVHSPTVVGDPSTFELTLDIVGGATLIATPSGSAVGPGSPARVQVCANAGELQGDGPLFGIVTFGPANTTGLVQIPVTWVRRAPEVFMPRLLTGWEEPVDGG